MFNRTLLALGLSLAFIPISKATEPNVAQRESIVCGLFKTRMDDKTNILNPDKMSPGPFWLAVNYALTPSGVADLDTVRRSDRNNLLGDAVVRAIPIKTDGSISLYAGSEKTGEDTYALLSFSGGARSGRVTATLVRMKNDKNYDFKNDHVFKGRCEIVHDSEGAFIESFEKIAR